MAVLIEFQSLIRSTWFLASDFTARQIKGSVKVNNLNQLINFKECRRNIATKGLGNIKKKDDCGDDIGVVDADINADEIVCVVRLWLLIIWLSRRPTESVTVNERKSQEPAHPAADDGRWGRS